MTNLAQLDPPKATGLIVHILEAIALLEKKIRPQQLLMARYYTAQDQPRLKKGETSLQWDFELQGVAPCAANSTPASCLNWTQSNLETSWTQTAVE